MQHRGQAGGRIIATNSKSLVFTIDEIPALYPTATSAYLMNPGTGVVGVDLVGLSNCTDAEIVRLSAELLIKSLTFKEDREEENLYNDLVRYMFADTASRLTSLHPEFSTFVVEYNEVSDESSRRPPTLIQRADRMMVYRRFTTDLGMWNKCDTGTLLLMAHSALRFLFVMHSHAHVHMDVKPDNLLCNIGDGAVAEVVLSDYGMVYPMDDVFYGIAPKDVGGADDEFDEGTRGFKSPLLRKNADDTTNHVFPVFTAIAKGHPRLASRISAAKAKKGKLAEEALNKLWSSYFSNKRRRIIRTPQDVAKVDLQSLGITMVRLLPGGVCSVELATPSSPDAAVLDLIRKLLLCETDSLYDANSALKLMAAAGLMPTAR